MENTTKAINQSGRIHRIWQRVSQPFRKKPVVPDEPKFKPDTPEDFQKRWDEAIKRFNEDLTVKLGDERVVEVVSRHVIQVSGELFGVAGAFHGKHGARYFHLELAAKSQAEMIVSDVNSKLNGRIKGYDTLLEGKINDRRDANDSYIAQKDKYEEFLDYSQHETRNFSRLLMWVYLIFAIVLLLADLPVSLSLVGYFRIGHTAGNAYFEEKIQDPELLMFSLGISFCTILVKILWDEYINTRLGSAQMTFDKLRTKYPHYTWSFRLEYWFKVLVKALLLAALFYTLFNLGKFRNAFSSIDVLNTDILKKESNIKDVVFKSFMGISVIIPIISGICLSMGLFILGNIRNLRALRKSRDQYYTKLNEKRNEVETTTKQREELVPFAAEWSAPVKIESITRLFISAYEGSYKYALLTVTDRDPYKLARYLHQEHLYNKFYHPKS